MEARVASGKQRCEGACLVDVGKFEFDIVVNQSFVHQPFETAFTECIVEVFYIIASQLIHGDANHKFGGTLLCLQVSDYQDCNKRRYYFSHPIFHHIFKLYASFFFNCHISPVYTVSGT